jgi:hypothetical protein
MSIAFDVVFAVFVVAIVVLAVVAVRWGLRRDRLARAARAGEDPATDTPGSASSPVAPDSTAKGRTR